jgi:hypothetical protein
VPPALTPMPAPLPGCCSEFKGDAPELPSPLQDPQHCFNSYYKQVGPLCGLTKGVGAH